MSKSGLENLDFLFYEQKGRTGVCFKDILLYTPKAKSPMPKAKSPMPKAKSPMPKAKSPTPQLSAHLNQSAYLGNPSVIFHTLF